MGGEHEELRPRPVLERGQTLIKKDINKTKVLKCSPMIFLFTD